MSIYRFWGKRIYPLFGHRIKNPKLLITLRIQSAK